MASDTVIGMFFTQAVTYVEDHDMWDEVVDFVVDASGIVVRVIH